MDQLGKALSLKFGRKKSLATQNELSSWKERSRGVSIVISETPSPSTSSTTVVSTPQRTHSPAHPDSSTHLHHYHTRSQADAWADDRNGDQLQLQALKHVQTASDAPQSSVTFSRKGTRRAERDAESIAPLDPGFGYAVQESTTRLKGPLEFGEREMSKTDEDTFVQRLRNMTLVTNTLPTAQDPRSLRQPQRTHPYPPSSYRDPFALAEGEGLSIHHRQRVQPEVSKLRPVRHKSTSITTDSAQQENSLWRDQMQLPPKAAQHGSNTTIRPTLTPTSSSFSISHAPTPFSSPDASPDPHLMLKPRRRSRSHSLNSSFRAGVFRNTPEPAEGYDRQVHHFTDCPHTSPPSHRPLNIQPETAVYRPGLLKYTPLHVRAQIHAHPAAAPQISIIAGSCSQCEWRMRRDIESAILNEFAAKRMWMERQIAWMGDSIGAASYLEELDRDRDREVRRCWRGYTASWGPGVVGINRGSEQNGDTAQTRPRSRTLSTSRGAVHDCLTDDVDDVVERGRMRLSWVRPDWKAE